MVVEDFWKHLVVAKTKYNSIEFSSLFYDPSNGFSNVQKPSSEICISISDQGCFGKIFNVYPSLYMSSKNDVPIAIAEYIRLYMPLLFAKALSIERPFVIGHIAQTLDGKICTCSGASKWISNEENLDHAHRVRAMADAVLVGSGTIREDHPKLSVRRVEGENPIRIFWSNSIVDFSSCEVPNTKTILLRKKNMDQSIIKGIDNCIEYDDGDEFNSVFEALKKEGIHSIFVEGGSSTISRFLNAKAIDLMQVHIAPIVFGSGKNGFDLEPIDKVDEALSFDGSFVHLGSHVMYSGRPVFT